MLDESYEYYEQLFRMHGKEPPTQKQLVFAQEYLKHRDRRLAWDRAGYASLDKKDPKKIPIYLSNMFKSEPVQLLLRVAMKEWADENSLNAAKLGQMAMDAYHNAPTVKDQIAALRLLIDLGFGKGKRKR